MSDTPYLRWTATVTYRTDDGDLDVVHSFEELHELHEIVERGPSFYSIVQIRIELTFPDIERVTVEQAELI
jgi:hypothetical protein